ncbi:MAG: 6-pyruvoyl-tetrahydropterin synthase-related protein [Anaerolineae bacterium]|nr:6-pyruvoyl-tetrahydropterin synthase-related protein [Anaerolineae bacterium]
MSRVRTMLARKFDPYLLVCLALGLLLCQPLLAAGIPNTADGLLHLYRSALWRWAWDEGVFWPRWHTMLYTGYGYPLFNFYAPLLYVVTGAASLIFPTFLDAFKAILVLIGIGYACGMYLWAKDILGRPAALVAATAYAFATFRFRELYVQGNYAQFLAWSLYPWILFFFHRLTRQPTPGRFIGAIASLAALLLAHNISALLLAPLLGAYLLGCMFVQRRVRRWRYTVLAALCALGIGG